ncbi:hypothetical protein JCM10449v2_000822 [Rhodotorula kratochvilovae]
MAKGKQKPPQPSAAPTPVAWPAIPRPSHPLRLDSPAEGLLTIDDFFPPKTRSAFVAAVSALALQPPSAPKKGEATRTNDRFSAQDPAFAQRLWEDSGLADVLEGLEGRNGRRARGLNPNIRCYRYSEGGYFDPHYDDDVHDPLTGWTTEWTLLVYLTGQEDGVVGGETAFYPTPSKRSNGPALVPELKAGRALLHRHGQHCALHEGRRVEKGVKWVLRSDVFFG